MEGEKDCPFCGERIKASAIKCKHCGSILSGNDASTGTGFIRPDTLVERALARSYEIKGVIGKGGMAVVYKAEQKSLSRAVALKVIHQNLVHDEEFLDRFSREARVSASLSHHHIVTVYDVGSVGSVHYMAMEYLQGITLTDYLRMHQRLNPEQTIKLILPIVYALEYIRTRGLVHRDLKSSNIIITENEARPVLTDFGIVYVSGEKGLSQSGAIVGTPEYMSPEQAEGKLELDHRSDVYSVGVILYECLVGKVPFHSENPLGTIHQVINERPPALHEKISTIPKWLSYLVLACLEKNREDRIQTAGELASYLSQRMFIAKKKAGNDTTSGQTIKVTKEAVKNFEKELSKHSQEKYNSNSATGQKEKGSLKYGVGKRNILIVAAIIVVSLTLAWLVYSNIKDPKAAYFLEQGDRKREAKKFDEAIVFYKQGKALSNDPIFDNRIRLAIEGKEAEKKKDKVEEEKEDKSNETEAKKGILIVSSDPAASIYINGNEVGVGMVSYELSAGTHTLEGRKQGFKTKRETVVIEDGDTITRTIKLEPDIVTPEGLGIKMVRVSGDGAIGDFSISNYEVTQNVWRKVMGSWPDSKFKGQDKPVENISMQEVNQFLRRLNELTGLSFRLPTETEWAYAAMGGVNGSSSSFSGSSDVNEVAWYSGNTQETKNAGSKKSNALGLYDMSGNVWELCDNGYLRGGSYRNPASNCTINTRKGAPSGKDDSVGFRVCLSGN